MIPDDGFPEQAVYTEWENSAFADDGAEATSCQACHMARADGVKVANRPRNLASRDNFARHGFYGGNTLMLDILDSNREALDVGDGDFAAAIEATRATLQSAADLVIEEAVIEQPEPGKRELVVRVRVQNNSGHKLPTSYPSRRAYLHLTVFDQNGDPVFESGRLSTDETGKPTGAIDGVDADTVAGYEPHYSGEITRPDQVQVYEPIMEDFVGNQTYTLLKAARYTKDNRILPRGFGDRPTAAIADVAVVGEAAADPDFVAGSDLVTYRVALPTAHRGHGRGGAQLPNPGLRLPAGPAPGRPGSRGRTLPCHVRGLGNSRRAHCLGRGSGGCARRYGADQRIADRELRVQLHRSDLHIRRGWIERWGWINYRLHMAIRRRLDRGWARRSAIASLPRVPTT